MRLVRRVLFTKLLVLRSPLAARSNAERVAPLIAAMYASVIVNQAQRRPVAVASIGVHCGLRLPVLQTNGRIGFGDRREA